MTSSVLRLITRSAIGLWRDRDRRGLIARRLVVVLVVCAVLWVLPLRLYVSAAAAMLAGALVERRYAKRRLQRIEHILILLQDPRDKQ
jgi:hypothetical protein